MDAALLWVITVGFSVCLIAVLFSCVCGCRKAEPKNELLGLAGNVKITNPDDTLARNGQWPPGGAGAGAHQVVEVDASGQAGPATATPATDLPDTNANKRCSTSANRSLPDLPVEPGRLRGSEDAVLWEGQEGGGDTGSELYATVEDNARPGSKKATASSSLLGERKDEVQQSFSRESISTRDGNTVNASDDDSFSTYARLKKEHPYDKLYKSEHPYAQVRSPGSRDKDTSNQTPSSNGDCSDPVPPPRARKSTSHGSLTPPLTPTGSQGSPPVSRSPRESVVDIEAATAIAGRVSASQDLPYMTPPLPNTSNTQFGQHFSGDSQDSSKGYTSISVREPLANIRPQRTKLADHHDSHYTTVSDDSDEMYAAIEDPSQVYTSGSETYAQIEPLVVAVPALATVVPPEIAEAFCDDAGGPSGGGPSSSPQGGPAPHPGQLAGHPSPAPQPPSVDSLKHVAQAHSRQASSSSATSSVANLGSPKPDKRAANSPLPPPPPSPSNLPSPEGGCSIEEMYAKVIKKKRGSNDEPDRRSQDTDSNGSHPSSPQRRYSTPQPVPVPAPVADSHEVANCTQRPKHSDPGYETVSVAKVVTKVADPLERDPGYETVKRNHNSSEGDPNYEELRVRSDDLSKLAQEIDGYQQIQVRSEPNPREPKYARLSRQQPRTSEPITEPDYASISRETKCAKKTAAAAVRIECETDDPGYERVAATATASAAAADPGYERVKARVKSQYQDSPDYESVRARNDDESTSDPGYERVRVAGKASNHADPNYESLHNEEPNYESVRYFSPNKIKDRGPANPRSNHVSNDGHDPTNVL